MQLLLLLGLSLVFLLSLPPVEGQEAVAADTDADGTVASSTDGTDANTDANGNADTDDDGAFEIEDLLPGFDNSYTESFVKNYILGNPEYYQEEYDPPPMVPKINSLPRFGHSDDCSLLIGDTPDNYFLGLLFVGTFVATLFTFWAISLCVLKKMGPRQVGFMAGFPFQKEGKKSACGRVVLSVSAWMMIISTIVLITKGLPKLQRWSDTVAMVTYDIQLVETEVQSIVTTLLVVSAKTSPIRDELVDFLKRDICPLEPGSDTEDQVRSVGEDTYDAMMDLDDFIEGYLIDVEDGVNQTNKFTNRVKQFTDVAQFVGNPKVTAVVFPYFILPAIILVAIGMGWYDVFHEGFYTFVTRVVLPLLIIWTAFAALMAAWMVVALEANADLCVSSGVPEDTILGILNKLDLDDDDDTGSESKDLNGPSDSFFYDIFAFYTHQCTMPNPWQFLEGHYGDLARGRNILGEFIRSIEDTTLEQLSQECGHEYGPIVELLFQLQDLITILSQTSIRAMTLMSCRNIVPLYTTFIYDATCTQAPKSLGWAVGCTLCIAFFGMMTITFRGAYYPIDYYYYDATGKGEPFDLYPPTDDDDSSNNLEDTPCNEMVLEEQEEQCIEAMEAIAIKGYEVYLDEDDDDENEDDENEDENEAKDNGNEDDTTAINNNDNFNDEEDDYGDGIDNDNNGNDGYEDEMDTSVGCDVFDNDNDTRTNASTTAESMSP